MLFVGLVRGDGWEPPDEVPAPPPAPRWHVPWRALAWVAAWWGLLALVPLVEHAFGGLVGYAFLLAVVALGFWRVERWCAGQYWRGLRDYQA
ncbi:MAG: hypothetical protein QOJ35_535 [Solirubrobacteraceae bacterium]|jgi:hypothetical protein|nr:hypothetical protein [Solirubrobacteraceae bacterium]